jgi:hypothetical protein
MTEKETVIEIIDIERFWLLLVKLIFLIIFLDYLRKEFFIEIFNEFKMKFIFFKCVINNFI